MSRERPDGFGSAVLALIERRQTNAVKEFAEKLKEKLKVNSNYGDIYDVVAYDCIDNLVKEMTEDKENV